MYILYIYIIQGVPKISTHTFGHIPPPCFIFDSEVALQMAYCIYLFEDSVTKIWKFDFIGPHPINIEVLILVFVHINMLETPLQHIARGHL